MENTVKELLSRVNTSMTAFQIDHFVIDESIIPYRMIRQILMELNARYTSASYTRIEIRKKEVEIEMSKEHISTLTGYEKELKELQIETLLLDLQQLQNQLFNVEYEISIFEGRFKEIASKFDVNSLILDESEEELYWINRLTKEAQIDLMVTGRLGKGVLDALMMLPEEHQKMIATNAIKNHLASSQMLEEIQSHILQKPTILTEEKKQLPVKKKKEE